MTDTDTTDTTDTIPQTRRPGPGPDQLRVPHPTDLPLFAVMSIKRETGVDVLDDSSDGVDNGSIVAALAYYVRRQRGEKVSFVQVANTTRRRDVWLDSPTVLDDQGADEPDPTVPPGSPSSPPDGGV